MMRSVSSRFLIPLTTLCAILPESLFQHSLPDSRTLKREELAIMRDEYYSPHGSDPEGRPSARHVDEVMPEAVKFQPRRSDS
jgi:hypothetical protein